MYRDYTMCRKKTRIFFLACIFHFSCFSAVGITSDELYLSGLTTNLLSNPEQVFSNGYLVSTPLNETSLQKDIFQFTAINTKQPFFGWTIHSDKNNTFQTAYQILVGSSIDSINNDSGDYWDSGKVDKDNSTNILYSGKPLEPSSIYFWKVKVWDNYNRESVYSKISSFKTGSELLNYSTDRYPIQKNDELSVHINATDKEKYFIDFGKAGFGRLKIDLYSETGNDTVIVHLGEVGENGKINRAPGGTRRYSNYKIGVRKGRNTYIVAVKPDKRNTGSRAILIPEYIGEVTPFRYCEIENYAHPLSIHDVKREIVYYPYDDTTSFFHSSDTILNQIWDLCKYSIKATSFLGIYVDGDRERIPYEADALINQLAHYGVAREYNMARYTHEYLINNPTWPTEWILQSVLMAWADYMYTGNISSLQQYYDDLKAKTLIALADDEGFISVQTEKLTPDVLKSIHFKGKLRDIVDWPHTGILGLEKSEGGETDGYVFKEINTVVNAFHYRTLVIMSKIAKILNKVEDSQHFTLQSERLKKSFNKKLFDKKRGIYVDGIGTEHASLHANMFPLAFGLVEEKNIESVLAFIRSRGMACSVYGSQFLLDAVYDAHDPDHGLNMLTSTDERSWYNMIRSGSTITMEAWDDKYKPNQDWNHAWGAAPANLIPRKLMGIEPEQPGFKKIKIKPQPSKLEYAEITHPTILGNVYVKFKNKENQSFELCVDIPVNSSADIYMPFYSKKQKLTLNGNPIKFKKEGKFSVIENVGSGKWILSVKK